MTRAGWGGIALLWIVALPWVGCGGKEASPDETVASPESASPDMPGTVIEPSGEAAAEEGEGERPPGVMYQVYFPSPGGGLHGEPREVSAELETDARIAALIEALLAGPQDPGLERPLPEGVTLGRVFLNDDGVVLLDLEADESVQLAMGSDREMLILAGLVDTVALNFEGAKSVVLLWNGVQRTTFAGHLDTTRPLLPRPELVRGGAAGD